MPPPPRLRGFLSLHWACAGLCRPPNRFALLTNGNKYNGYHTELSTKARPAPNTTWGGGNNSNACDSTQQSSSESGFCARLWDLNERHFCGSAMSPRCHKHCFACVWSDSYWRQALFALTRASVSTFSQQQHPSTFLLVLNAKVSVKCFVLF